MPALVDQRVQTAVATIAIANPPKNFLSADVRKAVADALALAVADPDVRVVVLSASGRTWPAGADLREFDRPPVSPTLADLCAAVAHCSKPVIAALHGTVFGGGLELALAADFRIAARGTALGMPSVSVGLMPGAGGTQRLPRLIGAKAALGLMMTGLPIGAERARDIGLIDHLAEGEVTVAANAVAADVVAGKLVLPLADRRDHVRDDPSGFLSEVAEARKGLADPRLPAPMRIVDCVEAALLLPEDEGHAYEQTAFDDLLVTPQSAALRHAYRALRQSVRPAELAGVLPRPVQHVGVIGAGPLGASIASSLLSAGYSVKLVDSDANVLAQGLSLIAATHETAVARGALSAEAREAEWDRVTGATAIREIGAAGLVIEATGQTPEAVGALLADLNPVLRSSTVLLTLSAGRDLDRLAAGTGRADDVIGLAAPENWHRDRLAEVIVGAQTAPAVVTTVLSVLQKIRKTAVRMRAGQATIGQRMRSAYQVALDDCQNRGATPAEIDSALTGFGFQRGPFHLGIGQAHDGPAVTQEALPMTASAIRHRVLAALANEGARLVEEGVAYCPSDIDVVMLSGFGYPRWRGGPMQTADQAGLLQIRNDLRQYSSEDGDFWHPAELWNELIKNGRKFASLNESG